MNRITKLAAIAAILSAVVLPAFSAIAIEGGTQNSLQNELSRQKKTEAEERKLKEQELRKSAKLNKSDMKACVRTTQGRIKAC